MIEFVVEDGSGKTNATSYGSVEAADQYHLNRGNTMWAALTPEAKQQNLNKASEYADQRFGKRWLGERGSVTQALDWPRSYVTGVEPDEIPVKLQYATFEYALRASVAPLAPDIKLNEAGVAMVTTSIKAGPVEKKFATTAGTSVPASVNLVRPYPGADMHLSRLVRSGGGAIH